MRHVGDVAACYRRKRKLPCGTNLTDYSFLTGNCAVHNMLESEYCIASIVYPEPFIPRANNYMIIT